MRREGCFSDAWVPTGGRRRVSPRGGDSPGQRPTRLGVLSCREAQGQGRSPDDSPFFLHGCRALAARRRGQGGAPGAQRGRTTLRAAACSKMIRQAGEEGSGHRRPRCESLRPVGGAPGAQSYLGARALGPATRWLMGAVPRHNCARSIFGGRRGWGPWRQNTCGSRTTVHLNVRWLDAHAHRRASGSRGFPADRWRLGWRHAGLSEVLEDVAGAPAELAGHRQARPVVVDVVPHLEVVGVVGRAPPGGALGGLEQRPAQHRRSLAGQVATRAPAVGLVDRDVQARAAHRLVRAVKAPALPQLRHDRHGREPAHAEELALQGTAPRLGLGERKALGAEGPQLGVEVVEHDETRLHRLATSWGHLHPSKTSAVRRIAEPKTRNDPLVEQLGLQALLPLDALVDQRLAQPHQGAQLQDVRRRDPATGEAALEQQVHHQLAVGMVGLGPALGAPPLAELGGIREVSGEAPPLDLLHHEAPARRPLQGEVGVGAWFEALQPFPDRLPGSRVDLASLHLTGAEVNRPERDLTSVQVQTAYHLHVGPPRAPSWTPRDYHACAVEAPLHVIFEMERVAVRGSLIRSLVRDDRGQFLGWYVYYLKPGGAGWVIQVAGERGKVDSVVDHLFHHAYTNGAGAVQGRAEPHLMEALSRRRCLLRYHGGSQIPTRATAR